MNEFLSTYQKDFLWPIASEDFQCECPRVEPRVEQGQAECKQQEYLAKIPQKFPRKSAKKCPCSPGGFMPQRYPKGKPVNFDVKCGCPPATDPKIKPLTREEMAEILYKAAEAGAFKIDCEKNIDCSSCLNKPDLNPLKGKPMKPPEPESYGQIRPMAPGQFGGVYEGPMNIQPTDQSQPYVFNTPCKCSPPPPISGPLDYGPAWIRERAREEQPGRMFKNEMEKDKPRTLPLAAVTCLPTNDSERRDSPNTFMKKLYEKYPYLYQILRDTPPDELIARVFKDRFLSTYQVDYLHMGSGKEHYPPGGSLMNEKYTGPDGTPEPEMIPGCFYRFNKKEFFGRKKSDLKMKEKWDSDDSLEKKEPDISEYMKSISKLGGDIISDQLYKVEAATKRMMKTYINF